MTDTDRKPRASKREKQLAKLRAALEARASQKPGDVIDPDPSQTYRWIDLGDPPGRVAELRALFASLGFEVADGMAVVGVAQAEVWAAPVEADELLFEARVAKNRARRERIDRGNRKAEPDARLIETIMSRLGRA